MQIYKNLSGDSGVAEFDVGRDWIAVRFRDRDKVYRYTHRMPGRAHVERMKVLAQAGRGLATYINRHVRDRYESWT